MRAFVAARSAFDVDLVGLAKSAIARVLADGSELRELWGDSDSFDEWRGVVTDLQVRLAGPGRE